MIIPTEDDFKLYFCRDFPFGEKPDVVMDSDITKAISEAGFNFNDSLFSNQSKFTMGYMYLAAHHLVINLRASSQGIAGAYSWLQASKGVGSVNESFSIPQRILDNPNFAMLSKTMYGAKFLSLILPQLVGQAFIVCGGTQP